MTSQDPEVAAMAALNSALKGLEPEARKRVLAWASQRFGNDPTASVMAQPEARPVVGDHADLPALYANAAPETEPERTLVGAYWFQVKMKQPDFDSQSVNTELKQMGHGVSNITRALDEIGADVLLAGHSTGGLVSALYAAEGERRAQVRALWLNSPFFDWRGGSAVQRKLRIASFLGRFFPFSNNPKAVLPAYVKSLHKNWDGEWEFDLALKPLNGFPAYFGWVKAIFEAHAKVHAGLSLDCPVLSTHSDEADIVLDWKQVARWSRTLGKNVSVLQFPGGLHDLVLSRSEIREEVFRQMFGWASTQ